MFETPRKSNNVRGVWSESQEELHEMQPVSAVDTSSRAKKKKKKKKPQPGGKRSVSAPQLSTEALPETVSSESLQGECTLNNNDEPIVRGIFQIGKRSYDVVLTVSRVTWTPIQPETPTGEPRSVFSVSMTISFCSCFSFSEPVGRPHFTPNMGQAGHGPLVGNKRTLC